MSWSLGYDAKWERDIGYGVPAYCDHPCCGAEIDRGLDHVCNKQQPYGGEDGCGLYFCEKHSDGEGTCARCAAGLMDPFKPSPEHPEWIIHKLTDQSWEGWRRNCPEKVDALERALEGDDRIRYAALKIANEQAVAANSLTGVDTLIHGAICDAFRAFARVIEEEAL